MLCRPSMFSSGCVRSRFSFVKRCAFRGSSHKGWWRLKSPIHMVCSGPVVCRCLSRSRMNADRCISALLLFPSLYTLITRNVPNCPFISTAVMSGCSKSICFHASVKILVLMRMTDLVLSGCVLCVLGYIVVQLWFARVLPWKSIYGSCIAHMSYVFRFRLCSRSSWLSRDLLTFCCRICSGR